MSFPRRRESRHDFSGNFTDRATPVPIPNTEVKPIEVDGTMVSRPWESRTLPVYLRCPVTIGYGAFLCIAPVSFRRMPESSKRIMRILLNRTFGTLQLT